MMNPLDVKKKVLGAVKSYGREGIGEHLKKGYGKPPAIAISIETMKAMPKHEGMEEMAEGEGEMPEKMLAKHEGMEPEAVKMAEGEHEMPDGSMMKNSEMAEGKGESKITPELLEMLLAKLGK